MARYDEHGPVVDVDREHGPEWDAMGAEVCTCGHRLDRHVEREITEGATRFECTHAFLDDGSNMTQCGCLDFTLDASFTWPS